MGRKVGKTDGIRVNIYLPKNSRKIAKQIDNLSAFVQLALEQAAGIMAFDIIRENQGLPKQPEPTSEAVARFNQDHPLDPLTAKRLGKQNGTTPKPLTRNPVIDN